MRVDCPASAFGPTLTSVVLESPRTCDASSNPIAVNSLAASLLKVPPSAHLST